MTKVHVCVCVPKWASSISTILLASPCCLEVICNDPPLPLTSSSLVQSFFSKFFYQKLSVDVGTSVGRFSHADPVLYPVLTMRTDWHFQMWKPTSQWESIQMHMYITFENRMGSLIELRSGSRSSLGLGFENKTKNVITWPVLTSPKKLCRLEIQSGSHNIMREPEPAGSHKKGENLPTLVGT
jgi:hypothetical protein